MWRLNNMQQQQQINNGSMKKSKSKSERKYLETNETKMQLSKIYGTQQKQF